MSSISPIIESKMELLSSNVQAFGTFLNAYKECSDEVRAIIDDMLEIVRDDDATKEEKEHAISVIAEALFPGLMQDVKNAHDALSRNRDSIAEVQRLDEQESRFAARLAQIMKQAGITQSELARKIGVHQSAISMMLKRDCRPQQRTVARLCEALSVSPRDLWPTPDDNAT